MNEKSDPPGVLEALEQLKEAIERGPASERGFASLLSLGYVVVLCLQAGFTFEEIRSFIFGKSG